MDWTPDSGVSVRWGDFFDCEPDWYWSVRDLPVLDLWLVTGGTGWIADTRSRTAIGAGDCLLLRPGDSYESGHDPEHPLGLIAVHFDLLDADGMALPPPDDLPPFTRRMEHSELLRELLTRAIHAHKDGRQDAGDGWFQAALLEVERQDARTWPPGLLGEQARAMDEICERIRRDPGADVRVEDLAAETHVSPEHFSRLFHRVQGMSPRAFITRTRIETAQRLLLTSSHSVARISRMLGYRTPYYFSRHFKANVGVAPSAYRTRP